MRILSINPLHDSSISLLNNGEIEFYCKEERLTKRKRDKLPILSLIECVKEVKGEIDVILLNNSDHTFRSKEEYELFLCTVNKITGVPFENIIDYSHNHHLSHASISFYNSGFDKALVVVVDGEGSHIDDAFTECESVYLASYPNNFEPVFKNFYRSPRVVYNNDFSDSPENIKKLESIFRCECNFTGNVGGIVNVYCTASEIISQSILENGKPMGLSSYGIKKKHFPKFFKDTKGTVNDELFLFENGKLLFREYRDKITNEVNVEKHKLYADYAQEIQSQTQESVGNIIEKSIIKTGVKKVCVSGGYGMNVVANHYYLKRFPDVDFYFEPLSDDSGITIGSAKLFYCDQTKDTTVRKLKTTSFHGKKYDVSSCGGKVSDVKNIASLLYDNKSVAVYTQLSESGQRALGNRSIFFNALNPDAKNIVNQIKRREWYRPFAAVVLEEDAHLYFDNVIPNPYMTVCFPVKTDLIPGVTHVDNTCRIQTVNSGYLYQLLKEFKKLSGHGILLNTSFNLAGEPLVESPEDAFNTLNRSSLDYLWFQETKSLFQK